MEPGETPDERIAAAVHAALVNDREVEGTPITVAVRDGVVRLRGSARSYARAAAERVAASIPGVRAVHNHLQVIDPWQPDDAALEHMARQALASDPEVPHDRIAVAVAAGIVTLTGAVADTAERLAAEAALDLPGVTDINNQIVVAGSPLAADKIADRIEHGFVAAARAAAARIAVRVDGDRIVLDGVANSETDRRLAERIALESGGVRGVDNHLRIEPA
jgi:osmotically-inducible protein OsmY